MSRPAWKGSGVLIGIALLLASAVARADLPLTAEGTRVAKNKVRIDGTTAPRATVSLYINTPCDEQAFVTKRAAGNGRFEFELTGALLLLVEPPSSATLRAESDGEQSACVAVHIVAPSDSAQQAPKPPAPKPKTDTDGMCMGNATRCALLFKGACFMQSGCYNPMSGFRCDGTVKQCSYFYTKSACDSQQGCTWVKN